MVELDESKAELKMLLIALVGLNTELDEVRTKMEWRAAEQQYEQGQPIISMV